MNAAELKKAIREKELARAELRRKVAHDIYNETVVSMLDMGELETNISIYDIERICNVELDGVMFYDLIRNDLIPLFVKNGFSAVWNEDEGDNRILVWAPIEE